VLLTLAAAALLYGLVAVGGRALGGEHWGAGLEDGGALADLVTQPFSTVVMIGGVAAMLGALLNLILGLSRVWLPWADATTCRPASPGSIIARLR